MTGRADRGTTTPVSIGAHADGSDGAERVVRPILVLDNLTVEYGRQTALEDISLQVFPGERVAVVGPNGAGKSTLFKAITGVVATRRGTIAVHGHGPGRDACVAYVPQRSEVGWSFPLTVADVVMMGRTAQIGWLRRPKAADRERVNRSLAILALEDLAEVRIGELSGGQQQRMFIARALAQDAELVLMDEPFHGLDAPALDDVLAAIDDLARRRIAVLVATHDVRLAEERFDRLLLLDRRAVAIGPPEEVLTDDNLRAAFAGRLHGGR